MPTTRDTIRTFDRGGAPFAFAPLFGGLFLLMEENYMTQEQKKKLTGIIVGLIVLAGFLTGLLGMIFSEKNREYFINRLKNIKNVPYIRQDKDPTR